jgi:deoxyribonuclease-4
VIEAVDFPRLGLCLDTCHLYVSGVDIRQPAQADALVDDVAARIGLERLRCLHVNDSAAPLGSNRDRHANVGEGELGVSIGVLLSHPALEGLPAILETPGPENKGADAAEIELARTYRRAGIDLRTTL